MDFMETILVLEERLKKPLPGRAAQLKMASISRLQSLMNFIHPDNAIPSSVLILLYPMDGDIGLVLEQRPKYKGIHSDQVSLPGGKSEDDDQSLIYTALREAAEETGIDPVQVQIIGQLTELYIPPSNFLVTPIVGYMAARPRFVADPKEVATLIEIPLRALLDPGNIKQQKMKIRRGFSLKAPAYVISGHTIWGATAMILSEFCSILEESKL